MFYKKCIYLINLLFKSLCYLSVLYIQANTIDLTKTLKKETSFDIVYAPWREVYHINSHKEKDHSSCPFCKILKENSDEKNFILKRFNHCIIMLNTYPYTRGSLLIIPFQHSAHLHTLTMTTMEEIGHILPLAESILLKSFSPDGISIGMSIGKAAGGSIPDHVHIHLIPRTIGDTSFFDLIDNTRVISVDLPSIYNTLKPLFDAVSIY